MNENQLLALKQSGKIKDYHISAAGKAPAASRPRETSRGLEWLEMNLAYWCNSKGISLEREYQFSDRKFRFDFYIPAMGCGIEFEGGIFLANSGHKTPKHYTKDTLKYNMAAILGFTVLRYTAMNYQYAINDLNQLYEKHCQHVNRGRV